MTKRHQTDTLKADIFEIEYVLFEAKASRIPTIVAKCLVARDQFDYFNDIVFRQSDRIVNVLNVVRRGRYAKEDGYRNRGYKKEHDKKQRDG